MRRGSIARLTIFLQPGWHSVTPLGFIMSLPLAVQLVRSFTSARRGRNQEKARVRPLPEIALSSASPVIFPMMGLSSKTPSLSYASDGHGFVLRFGCKTAQLRKTKPTSVGFVYRNQSWENTEGVRNLYLIIAISREYMR